MVVSMVTEVTLLYIWGWLDWMDKGGAGVIEINAISFCLKVVKNILILGLRNSKVELWD